MNLPIYPTDNLYKFLAIAGLILAGYSAFFAYHQVVELEIRIIRADTDERILNTERKQVLKTLDILLDKQKEEDLTRREIEQIVERTMAALRQGEQVTGKARENLRLFKQYALYYVFFQVGIFGGLFLSLLGFVLWYLRIQKPSDAIMKKRMSE